MLLDFSGGSDGKESACSAGDPGLIPGSGRCPGEGNGSPLQYSCLENPMTEEPGGLRATAHGSQRVGHDQVSSLFTFSHLSFISPDVSAKSEENQLLQMSSNRSSPEGLQAVLRSHSFPPYYFGQTFYLIE